MQSIYHVAFTQTVVMVSRHDASPPLRQWAHTLLTSDLCLSTGARVALGGAPWGWAGSGEPRPPGPGRPLSPAGCVEPCFNCSSVCNLMTIHSCWLRTPSYKKEYSNKNERIKRLTSIIRTKVLSKESWSTVSVLTCVARVVQWEWWPPIPDQREFGIKPNSETEQPRLLDTTMFRPAVSGEQSVT